MTTRRLSVGWRGHDGFERVPLFGVSSVIRQCSRTACKEPAVATLTYVYADSTAVLGPLAVHAEPHSYDLCLEHATSLTVPRGWDVVRLSGEYARPDQHDDLVAIANAVTAEQDVPDTEALVGEGSGARGEGTYVPRRPRRPGSSEPGKPNLRVLPPHSS